jgi:hypothetical protein
MKESLKDWCKEWTIEEIAHSLFSEGMGYMSISNGDPRGKQFIDNKNILVKELKKRYKK